LIGIKIVIAKKVRGAKRLLRRVDLRHGTPIEQLAACGLAADQKIIAQAEALRAVLASLRGEMPEIQRSIERLGLRERIRAT
jgi:hypothetical protein